MSNGDRAKASDDRTPKQLDAASGGELRTFTAGATLQRVATKAAPTAGKVVPHNV